MQRAKPKLRSMMSESGTTGDDHLQPLAWKLRSIVGEDNVLVNEPMSEHTSFEIGGPADLFVIPEDFDEVHNVIDACKQADVPYFVLGADGLVGVSVDDDEMWCQAGVTLREASEMACELGLSGLEFACGIPGSIGGACFMNAGAYGGCMADVLKNVHVLHQDGREETIPVDELDDPEKIRETMDELTRRREEKQPLELPSAGSTFKRPEGYFVGKLVTDAGLRGYQVGGAAVSKKHAGFVVNVGGATAADVRAVIAHVQDEVERQFGVRLEPEVRFLG